MDAPCCCGAGKAWQTADKQGGGLQGSTRAQRHGDVGAEGRATHDCMRAHVIGPARHKQGSEQADQRERKRPEPLAVHKTATTCTNEVPQSISSPWHEERAARDAQAQPTGTPVPRSAAWLLAST